MVSVTAREAFAYDGVNRRVGQSFAVPSDDARILVLVGRVRLADKTATPAAAPAASIDTDAETETAAAAPTVARRRSRRQDIVPEA